MDGSIVIVAQDFGDLIGVLIIIVIILFSGVQQFIQKIREAMEKQKEEQERRRSGESYSSRKTILERDIEDIESEWDAGSILSREEEPQDVQPSYQYDPLQSSSGTMPPPVPEAPRQPPAAPPPLPQTSAPTAPSSELERMHEIMQKYEQQLRQEASPIQDLAQVGGDYRQLLREARAEREKYIVGKGTAREMELDLSSQGARKAYIYREIFGPPRGRMPFLRARRAMR